MSRCEGQTAAGKRCKARAGPGGYCAQHHDQEQERCTALTGNGQRCKHKAVADGKCQLHRPREADPAKGGRKLCQGFTADGGPCKNKAVAGGYCGRHRDQIESPDAWQALTEKDIERRKQFALMRTRELLVAEEENRLIDAGLARAEAMRLAGVIQNQISTIPGRRSHEIAAQLKVQPGAVAAVLEAVLRAELKEIAESL